MVVYTVSDCAVTGQNGSGQNVIGQNGMDKMVASFRIVYN